MEMNFITRHEQGIMKDNQVQLSKGLRQYVNSLCLKHGSSLDGRIASSRYLLKRRSLVPIYVNSDICLIPTSSLRDQHMIYLNTHQIASLASNQDGTTVMFMDGSTCHVPVQQSVLLKRQRLANKLLTYFSK